MDAMAPENNELQVQEYGRSRKSVCFNLQRFKEEHGEDACEQIIRMLGCSENTGVLELTDEHFRLMQEHFGTNIIFGNHKSKLTSAQVRFIR